MSLIISLIVVVLMTISGIAMMRQIGLGLSIAGNLAFKQNATSAADLGVENAYVYLTSPANTTSFLAIDHTDNNYYGTWTGGFGNGSPVNWAGWDDGTLGRAPVTDTSGNEVQYVIQRLCKDINKMPADPTQECSNLKSVIGNSTGGATGYSVPPLPYIAAYFRVTTRVRGPRNTVSYTQVILMN